MCLRGILRIQIGASSRNSVYATTPLYSTLAGNCTPWNTAYSRPPFFSPPSRSSRYGCSKYSQVNLFQLLTFPPQTAPRGQSGIRQVVSPPETTHVPAFPRCARGGRRGRRSSRQLRDKSDELLKKLVKRMTEPSLIRMITS